ncbi:MAG: hypothetical protein V1876_00700, partial [Candidatus Peregrinibacteria bacterium]
MGRPEKPLVVVSSRPGVGAALAKVLGTLTESEVRIFASAEEARKAVARSPNAVLVPVTKDGIELRRWLWESLRGLGPDLKLRNPIIVLGVEDEP